jgi:hypothetical protein
VKDLHFSFSYRINDEWRHLFQDDVEKVTVSAFAALVKINQDPLIDPHEHDQWFWCNFEKALELVDWPDNQAALKLCEQELGLSEK